MRVFFAVALPAVVRNRLAEFAHHLELEAPAAGVSWVPRDNFHLTLRFVGQVGARELALAKEAAREVAGSSAPFKLSLEGVGTFPGGKAPPRVLWVGARDDAGLVALRTVARSVEDALVGRGFAPADHAFSPHATLGHVKPKRRGRQHPPGAPSPDAALAKLASVFGAAGSFEGGTVDVEKIVLFESVSQGRDSSPDYRPVETFKLGVAADALRPPP